MISFIAPYKRLKELADSASARFNVPIKTCLGNLYDGLEIAREELNCAPCILISRGGTADLISRKLNMQVIEVNISIYDLLKVLVDHDQSNQQIAIVGYDFLVEKAEKICEILSIPASFYRVEKDTNLHTIMKQLKNDQVDVVVGDVISTDIAVEYQIQYHLIESGVDAVTDALSKAVTLHHYLATINEKTHKNEAIINNVREYIFFTDAEGKIEQANPQAIGLFPEYSSIIGTNIGDIIPFDDFPAKTSSGVPMEGVVISLNRGEFYASVIPVEVHGERGGVVVILQEISFIQQIEKKIRTQLHAKGLVARYHFRDIVSISGRMLKCIETAKKYSKSPSSICIHGETGTGKELMAQSMHNESTVQDGPFVAVNCGALPEHLLESELFGYVKGAFTGADPKGKQGLFELAHKGTLFLDEVHELDIRLQVKLLRALQEKEIMRIGDNRVIHVDVRVIAASNIPLYSEVLAGRFRRDLYYRLNILSLDIPPLRERREDIPVLFDHFMQQFSKQYRYKQRSRDNVLNHLLQSYPWPGNIREIRNMAERYVILGKLTAEDFTDHDGIDHSGGKPGADFFTGTLLDIERKIVARILNEEQGNISRTSKRLKIDRNTLKRKLHDQAQQEKNS